MHTNKFETRMKLISMDKLYGFPYIQRQKIIKEWLKIEKFCSVVNERVILVNIFFLLHVQNYLYLFFAYIVFVFR